MLVQAQVVPWWGTGRPVELSPSGSNPVTGTAHRQEDSGVRLQNRGDSVTAWGQLHSRLSQEPKSAGDLARQIQPLPSRSRRCLDYETSGSPSPSRSYRRPETESLQVTEVTSSNLRHARPGAG